MAPQRPDDIDRQLRESFGVEPAAVRRIVAGAKAAPGRLPLRNWALRTGLAAAVVLTLAAMAWWPRPQSPAEPAAPVVSGVLYDGVLVLTFPDGSASIVGADRGDERPPDGFGIVLIDVEGDRQ